MTEKQNNTSNCVVVAVTVTVVVTVAVTVVVAVAVVLSNTSPIAEELVLSVATTVPGVLAGTVVTGATSIS
jgi:hypothetical protein